MMIAPVPTPTMPPGHVDVADVLTRWPACGDDLRNLAKWMPGGFRVSLSREPMDRFRETAFALLATYPTFPAEGRRSDRILRLLRLGEPPRPVFVDAQDGFIMEGRHRIVAFLLHGMAEIDVVTVSDA